MSVSDQKTLLCVVLEGRDEQHILSFNLEVLCYMHFLFIYAFVIIKWKTYVWRTVISLFVFDNWMKCFSLWHKFSIPHLNEIITQNAKWRGVLHFSVANTKCKTVSFHDDVQRSFILFEMETHCLCKNEKHVECKIQLKMYSVIKNQKLNNRFFNMCLSLNFDTVNAYIKGNYT